MTVGRGDQGALGHGREGAKNTHIPKKIMGPLIGQKVRWVAAGEAHSMCLTVAGHLWCWGANSQGQLGLGDKELR